jgi:hypothetical protein
MTVNLIANVLFFIFLGVLFWAGSTNTRTKTTVTPIVKVTDTHYVTRDHGELTYHKLPNSYKITSKKSHIKKVSAPYFYVGAKNHNDIKTTYYINPNQK